MGRDITFGARYNSGTPKMTQWEKSRIGRSHQSFKGSTLVSTLIEQNPYRFKNRPDALKFARKLFREGTVKSIYETSTFEDSGQLYAWNENDNTSNPGQRYAPQTPSKYGHVGYHSSNQHRVTYAEADDRRILDAAKQKLRNKRESSSVVKKFFKELESEYSETKCNQKTFSNPNHITASAWLNQRPSTSSVDNRGYRKFRDRSHTRITTSMAMAAQHDVIPEEEQSLDVTTEGNSLELELAPRLNDQPNPRWQDSHSYSDNEKQLIEEMDRMKEDHKETLKNYEERIEKLMAKMHELRGIAETLESSGNKTYGLLPVTTRTSLLNFIDDKLDDGKKTMSMTFGPSLEMPPPLPPRPGRSSNACPSKPVINPKVKMKTLDWTRLILKDVVEQNQTTVWHTMREPKLDPDEVERLFQSTDVTTGEGGSLYDDMAKLRGKTKQLVTLLDVEKSRRAVYTMKCLPCTMNDVINAVSSLDTSQINSDRFAELLELLGGGNEIERVQFHVRRKSPASLDYPEYLLLELTKINHCKERMDFMRFRHRIQWHLFETEQQLKEVHTACDEVTNSLPLKNLLETLLATGNYLNGGSMNGQADGFCIEVINKLKEIQDRDGKGHLLEFVLKLYCQYYEVEVELGCPTKFKLPEPSNMRHAAQVSFDNIQDALSNMKAEVKSTREKFLTLAAKENNDNPDSLWTAAEKFITNSLEMIGEEEKLLQNTRVLFQKTTSYFLYDMNQNNPQQFFQLWAVFLHDCKYFWKLAHRKIGKERFEIDFKHRGQLPSMYVAGNDHHRTHMMRRPNNTLETKPTPSVPSKALHGWMESLGDTEYRPEVPPLPHQEITKTQLDALQNSPSPKMLTNEPPLSSSVHKPLPKTPAISVKNENDVTKLSHNYENQEDIERTINETPNENQTVHTDHHPQDGTPKKTDKHPPFSFKWLKRDQTNRNNSGDSRSSADSNKPEMDGTKRLSSQGVTPFAKFKNSMAQKFNTGSSASQKRNIDSVEESQETVQEQPVLPTRHVPSFTPLKVTISENEINPYETSLGREQRAQIAALAEAHRYVRDNRTSSAERRSQFDVGRGKIRNASVVSTEYAALYHTPPFSTNNIDKDGYSSPHILRPFATKSDINNNTPQYQGHNVTLEKTEGVRRTRAPIALGSNLSISDAYSRPDDHLPHRHAEFDQSSSGVTHSLPESSNTFHQAPVSVPSYNAKRVHNYENQGKFDNVSGTRYRADPVSLPANPMPISTQNNPFSSLNQTPSTTVSKYSPNILMKESNLKVKDPGTGNTHDVNIPNGDVRIGVPPKPSRNMQLNFHDPKRDHKFSPMSEKQGQKGPPSIATLINQFEKKQNLLEANSSDNIDRQTIDNKVAVTSTPVTQKGLIGTHDEPPPVPPRADQSFQDHYPSDSLESRSSRGKGRILINGFDGGYNSNTSQKSSPVVDQHYRNPGTGGSAPQKVIHSRQETGLSDQDDSYKDRLRKANSSIFDRFTKQLASSSYNKQTNSLQFSTPQYSRQSSNQTTTNSLPYSRQNSNQPNSQPTRQNGLIAQPPVKPPKQMPFVRNLFGNERDQQDITSRPPQQHVDDGNDEFDSNHLRNSPLAVVKPTVVNRGSVTFMEI